MNNDISLRPAYLTDEIQGDFGDSIGFVQPPRISMESQRFNVLDENGDKVMGESIDLHVIMLSANDTRIYYSGEYDPNNPAPPACFSNDKIAPDSMAQEPQSERCANCPRAVRDQPGYTGKGMVPACKEEFKVACLVAGAPSGKIFQLTIKSWSRQPFARYMQFLRQNHARPEQVITKLTYNANQFGFERADWISEAHARVVREILKTDEPALIVGAGPRQPALPKPSEPPKTIAWGPDGPEPGFGATADPPKRGRGRPPGALNKPKEAPGPAPAAFVGTSTPEVSARVSKVQDYSQGVPLPTAAASAPVQNWGAQVWNKLPLPHAETPASKNNGGFGMEPAQPISEEMARRLDEAFGR